MKFTIRHRTHYGYAAIASQSYNQICLLPRSTRTQSCLQTGLEVQPKPEHIERKVDQFGNEVATFNLSVEHRECDIIITSLIETTDTLEPLPLSASQQQNLSTLSSMHHNDALMAKDCLLGSPSIAIDYSVDSIINELPVNDLPVLEYANLLTSHIFTTFTYESGFSSLVTPLTDIVAARRGVCQDFAHLAIAVMRRQGIPARYVSGYLETLPPPGQEKLQGSDASHAWFAVYSANDGWYDFDPTNNKRPDAQYITTAWGRDYADVVPVKGVVFGGGSHTLTVEVDVTRIDASATLEPVVPQ